MLKIINFSKTYGNNKKKAVDNLNLEIKKGDILVSSVQMVAVKLQL